MTPTRPGMALRVAILAWMTLCLCGGRLATASGGERPWSLGIWYWNVQDQRPAPPEGLEPDRIYVEAGHASRDRPGEPGKAGAWHLRAMLWPAELPPGRAYLAVLRVDGAAVPDIGLAGHVAEWLAALRRQAAGQGRNLLGLQIDYDCPTAKLRDYGRFLAKLRAALAPDVELSVTALLDWFADSGAARTALEVVDEFVPQFYDLGSASQTRDGDGPPRIAEIPEGEHWSGRFEAVGRPYRIGLAAFGRFYGRSPGVRDPVAAADRGLWRDEGRLDRLRGMVLTGTGDSEAGERVLRFREPGDGAGGEAAVILPTPEGLVRAVRQARGFGPACRGLAVFRWPGAEESLVLTPGEIRRALGEAEADGSGSPVGAPDRLEAAGGDCPAGWCCDLRVRPGKRFLAQETRYRITANRPLFYFLPAQGGRTRQTGPRTVEMVVAPFEGAPSFAVGRAVTTGAVSFSLENIP